MSELNVGHVATAIIEAMRGSFDEQWPGIKEYATGEARKLAETFAQIQAMRRTHDITEGEAAVLLEMQKNSARAVMLAVKGMGTIAVQTAINAALDAVRGIVNPALGFALV